MGFGIKTKILQLIDYLATRKVPHLRLWLNKDTTQYGEFSYLKSIFATSSGLLVDVGANDGFTCSNSFPFITRGWQAILVEPHPKVFRVLQDRYENTPRVRLFNCACAGNPGKMPLFEGSADNSVYATLSTESSEWFEATRSGVQYEVEVQRLETLLESASCPEEFEILSIDTEGFDYQVLLGLNLSRFRPKVIITEDEKPPFTDAKAKTTLLSSHGYQLKRKFHNNGIWVRTP